MKDMDKTKKQLFNEITDLRQKIKAFEDVSHSRSEKFPEIEQNEELSSMYQSLTNVSAENSIEGYELAVLRSINWKNMNIEVTFIYILSQI